jgi:hypothetical protein
MISAYILFDIEACLCRRPLQMLTFGRPGFGGTFASDPMNKNRASGSLLSLSLLSCSLHAVVKLSLNLSRSSSHASLPSTASDLTTPTTAAESPATMYSGVHPSAPPAVRPTVKIKLKLTSSSASIAPASDALAPAQPSATPAAASAKKRKRPSGSTTTTGSRSKSSKTRKSTAPVGDGASTPAVDRRPPVAKKLYDVLKQAISLFIKYAIHI